MFSGGIESYVTFGIRGLKNYASRTETKWRAHLINYPESWSKSLHIMKNSVKIFGVWDHAILCLIVGNIMSQMKQSKNTSQGLTVPTPALPPNVILSSRF